MTKAAPGVCVVTGASSGIGAALARIFAANGYRVVLIARREEMLERLSSEIEQSGAPTPVVIPCDLAQPDAGETIAHAMRDQAMAPTIIVNNAGFAVAGAAAETSLSEQLAMVDVNIRALTDLSLRFAGALIANKGAILNVGSVAGFLPGPYMAVYYASKAYVLSLSEALHAELSPHGVRVSALCPGPVSTGFQARARVQASRSPLLSALSAEDVARAGYDGLMAGRRVIVPGLANRVAVLASRVVPRGLLLRAIARIQRGRVLID